MAKLVDQTLTVLSMKFDSNGKNILVGLGHMTLAGPGELFSIPFKPQALPLLSIGMPLHVLVQTPEKVVVNNKPEEKKVVTDLPVDFNEKTEETETKVLEGEVKPEEVKAGVG